VSRTEFDGGPEASTPASVGGPSRGHRTPPPRRLLHSPHGLATKTTGPPHSPSWQAQTKLHSYTAVAQTPEGLTGSVLRVGSKTPKVIARPRRALLGRGAPSAFHGRHSERRPDFRRRLCATASWASERRRRRRPDARIGRRPGALAEERHTPAYAAQCGSARAPLCCGDRFATKPAVQSLLFRLSADRRGGWRSQAPLRS
jgi:hypothetical protein